MTDPLAAPSHDETVALFRYGLIADLLHLPPGHRTLHARLRAWVKKGYVDADATIPYHPGAVKFYKEVGIWQGK